MNPLVTQLIVTYGTLLTVLFVSTFGVAMSVTLVKLLKMIAEANRNAH